MFKCPNCCLEFERLNSLRIHASKLHKLSSINLRLFLFHDNRRPLCECGCGKETRFINVFDGFNKFIRGHQSRVHNNWGHNSKALQKSQDARREQIELGTWHPWNLGKTSDSDDRVAAYGRTCSRTIRDDSEEIERRSRLMSKLRLNRTIPTLYGSDHPQWKGGVSSVQELARSYVFNVWAFPKLSEQKFTCQLCSSQKDICVHHDKERFADILQKARIELGDVDSFEKIQVYAKWIADYHIENDVSGVVLCKECHDLQHKSAL